MSSNEAVAACFEEMAKLLDLLGADSFRVTAHARAARVIADYPGDIASLAADRTEILQIIEHYAGKTVDLQEDSLIALISGNTDKLDAALRLLGKFDIVETVRTGKVVMARGLAET